MEKINQPQKILAIETSGKMFSVALGESSVLMSSLQPSGNPLPRRERAGARVNNENASGSSHVQFSVKAELFFDVGLRHSEILKDACVFLMEKCNWKKEDLTAIAVSVGPGSFTGARVGVTFARAIAQMLSLPLIGIPTFEIIAEGIHRLSFTHRGCVKTQPSYHSESVGRRISPFKLIETEVLPKGRESDFVTSCHSVQDDTEVMTQSRKRESSSSVPSLNKLCIMINSIGNEVFAGFFDAKHESPSEPYKVFALSDILQKLKNESKIVVAGEGYLQHETEIKKSLGSRIVDIPLELNFPHARYVAKLAYEKINNARGKIYNWKKVVPFYLRPPLVVERLQKIKRRK